MKKSIFTLALVAVVGLANAQTYNLVTIDSIQYRSQADLANGIQEPRKLGDTIRVRGVVSIPGGLSNNQNGKNVCMQTDTMPWQGINIYAASKDQVTQPVDMLNLQSGDQIEVVAKISEYSKNTQLTPISISKTSTQKKDVYFKRLKAGDLNDANQKAIYTSGEQWEGLLASFDLHVITDVTTLSGGTRVKFAMMDPATGNKIPVFDRYVYNQGGSGTGNTIMSPVTVGGAVCAQIVRELTTDTLCAGDTISFMKGVIVHFTSGSTTDEYNIYPFDKSHFGTVVLNKAPRIVSVKRDPVTPTAADNIKVTAEIQANSGKGIKTADLFYHVADSLVSISQYTKVAMSQVAGKWEATIPSSAFSNNSIVKYYVEATDSNNYSRLAPRVDEGQAPFYVRVNNAGITVEQIQFVPVKLGSDASGYVGQEVTVKGVIASSSAAGNVGRVFMVQRGATEWGGIMLNGSLVGSVNVGDSVTVTGNVREDFGLTVIDVTNVTTSVTGLKLTPIAVDPGMLKSYDRLTNEKYEGMLVALKNPTANGLVYVIDTNVNKPNANYGVFRIGIDTFNVANGTRVQTGNKVGSDISTKASRYVNSQKWVAAGDLVGNPYILKPNTRFESVAGVLYYGFGNYTLLPRDSVDFLGGPLGTFVAGFRRGVLANQDVKMYPNPATSTIEVSLEQLPAQTLTLSLIDLSGKVVTSQVLSGNTTRVAVANLNRGMYLAVIRDQDGLPVFSGKIILAQ